MEKHIRNTVFTFNTSESAYIYTYMYKKTHTNVILAKSFWKKLPLIYIIINSQRQMNKFSESKNWLQAGETVHSGI
jgi:hypothetical protein